MNDFSIPVFISIIINKFLLLIITELTEDTDVRKQMI